MSTFNYMENVPVKISENYKPLPKVLQLPQAICRQLQLPHSHYHDSPQYAYNFALEKKVATKIKKWRRIRQQQNDLRQERMQKREEQRNMALEKKNKEMLCAVNYPDAAEFLTDDYASDKDGQRLATDLGTKAPSVLGNYVTQIGNFHEILKPTILPPTSCNVDNVSKKIHNTSHHARNKSSSSFDYKDFEEDTSSPFDNIELKTINDLDILAQVLKNTQMKSDKQGATEDICKKSEELTTRRQELCNSENQNITGTSFQEVDYRIHCTQLPNANIPIEHENVTTYPDIATNHGSAKCAQPDLPSNIIYRTQNNNQTILPQKDNPFVGDNNHSPYEQPEISASYNRQHQNSAAVAAGNLCPSVLSNGNAYCVPTQIGVIPYVRTFSGVPVTSDVTNELRNKSKSVPDILNELKDEVTKARIRRARNYSCNMEDNGTDNEKGSDGNGEQDPSTNTSYTKLDSSKQKLAYLISSMGFPLERVAKVVQICGADDKKVIEHLIPLSELIDFGFDESKISEALLRFDNNKEKALEYLIS